MTKAREFQPLEDLKTPAAARARLTRIQRYIAMFSSLVPLPALAESFRNDEQRLLAVMADRGWGLSTSRQPRFKVSP